MDGGFVQLVKLAVDYTNRTGRDGLAMSPLRLQFAIRVLRDQDRRQRIDIAEAVATAMSGKEEHWKALAR